MSGYFRRNRLVVMFRKATFVVKRCVVGGAGFCTSVVEPQVISKLSAVMAEGWPSATYQKFAWMTNYAPCFPIKGEQVLVLTEPTQFYEVLKVKTKKAKKRITFASLYLGTGPLEKELVTCMSEACCNAEVNQTADFKVNVLLDMTRGSRGPENSRTMLLGLVNRYQKQVNVSLYHTPDLRGMLRRIVPERFNEVIGLTHLKVYLVDDSIIISGANLSNDYFTNRQDRYVLFNDCKDMADFFDQLVKTVSSFSFQLQTDNTLQLHPLWKAHPFQGNCDDFKRAAKERIENLMTKYMDVQNKTLRQQVMPEVHNTNSNAADTSVPNASDADTWVYPLVQMGPFSIFYDEYATLHLMKEAARQDEILLASGYFNLTDHYLQVILQESLAKYRLLMAAPEVNGFYGARGIAGYIPAAYIHIARRFFDEVQQYEQGQRIQLYEYFRDKWTFHVKGLWYYLPQKTLPSLTLVGSPNFGYRSIYRDLECQVALVTDNTQLQEQLREEHARLYQSSVVVTADRFQRADRRVPTWVSYVTGFIKHYF